MRVLSIRRRAIRSRTQAHFFLPSYITPLPPPPHYLFIDTQPQECDAHAAPATYPSRRVLFFPRERSRESEFARTG